jgi:hypothetical protein
MIRSISINEQAKLRKLLIFFITVFLALILINIVAFFSTDFDQFNIFYKYQKIYRLETWNIPNNADVDINGDGIGDRISWTGCIFLSGSLDKDIVAKQYDCTNSKSDGISVFNPNEFNKHEVRLSYLGKSGDSWNIILVRNWYTDSYSISKQGIISKNRPPIQLKMDSFIYFVTHLFVLFIGM